MGSDFVADFEDESGKQESNVAEQIRSIRRERCTSAVLGANLVRIEFVRI